MREIKGHIHSIQSLGTLDGPGVRFVVFMQGCTLRCSCCHNPDTWSLSGGTEMTAGDIIERLSRYTDYFGTNGGITLSGGEPLLQPEFVSAVFSLCREMKIHTCLDTAGISLNDEVKKALSVTERVLLDFKYTKENLYQEHVGCSMQTPLDFLRHLDKEHIPVTLRQVIVPGLNDNKENILALNEIIHNYSCIDNVELLPFRKICQTKYDALQISFPFAHRQEPSKDAMQKLEKLLVL